MEGMGNYCRKNTKKISIVNNSRENIKHKFDKVVDALLLDYVTSKTELFKKLTEPKVNHLFKNKWFGEYYQQYVQ